MSDSSAKEVAVVIDRKSKVRSLPRGLVLACVLLSSGCGGSASDGSAAASTEEGKRYESLQKKGLMHSRADIAAKKKEAMAEIAQKKKLPASEP